MNELETRTFKIGLIGENDSGMEEFVNKYCEKLSGEEYEEPLGIGFYIKRIKLEEENYYIQLCTQGSEPRFKYLLPSYLKNSIGTIILFNLFNPSAFSQIPIWVHLIESNTFNHPILLAGNNPKEADFEQIRSKGFMEFVRYNNFAMYIDISTKSGKNVNLMFEILLDFILENFDLSIWRTINKFTWYDNKGYPHFDIIPEIMTNEEHNRIFNVYQPKIQCIYCYMKFHCPSYKNINSCEIQDWIISEDYLDAEKEHKQMYKVNY